MSALLRGVRALLLVAGFAAAAATQAAQSYSNPIIRGDWSDPGVIRVGDDYYSCRSSFGWQPGLPIAHSRDLVHWEYIGHAFATHPKLQPGDTRFGIWGVEMGYNPNTKQFLIYAPTRDGEVFAYYADKPEGPYQVKSLGNLGIDPGFFADDDGRVYLICNKAAILELERDGLSVKRQVAQINRSAYKLFEGPDIFKHGGWYYLLLSDGGTLPHEPSTITTLRARKLEGPWESDPGNPTMFSTDNGARFEGPAHGTLIDTPAGEWFVTYHAHETAFYTLGRQMLMEPIEWTADGWWRPKGGKVPTEQSPAPKLPASEARFAQTDEFDAPQLGLQWFFTCAPDFTGGAWSLSEAPGKLRIHTQPGDLGSIEALPGVFQQRVIDKAFAVETRVAFEAHDGREAAGLHFYHDPLMNFWLATTVRDGKQQIEVGKFNLGRRTDLWSAPNPFGETVHLRIVVDGQEGATFFFGPDGREWQQIGEKIYFGASGHHLREQRRGDPDIGWVGRYKDRSAPAEPATGPAIARLPNRNGNVWTGATFGVFAVRDGAAKARNADFDFVRVVATASTAMAAARSPAVAGLTLFPTAGARDVCPDTTLRITFPAAQTVGTAGKIQLCDAADGAVLDTIDVSAPTATKTIGGLANYHYYPVIVEDRVATIAFKNNLLAYGKSYYVTVEAGVFKDPTGATAAIDGPNAWRFSTRAAGPAAGATKLTIAADGTGDFCTVQGALDFIPDGNRAPTTLLLKKGVYSEIVSVTNKHAITLLGEDRKGSVITYRNNARLNPQGSPYRRGMLLAHRCEDFTIANLTLRNTTPPGGSQAESIILNGTTTARAIVKDVDLYSLQDTLQINGQAYVANCYIEGDVDFMWGTGPTFFENCIARSTRSKAYYTQIRNRATNHGYVYYHCTFDGTAGVVDNFLSRIAPSRFPASEVVLVDCTLTEAVGKVAWLFEAAQPGAAVGAGPEVHFWEFNSHDPSGRPVEVAGRMAGSRQLKAPEDDEIIANYRNPRWVLGNDWDPRASAIFKSR